LIPLRSRPGSLFLEFGRFKAGPRERRPIPKTCWGSPNQPGVRPMIETYPLEKAAGAYARMMNSKPQFRVVLTM
jgi:hypothetical protein